MEIHPEIHVLCFLSTHRWTAWICALSTLVPRTSLPRKGSPKTFPSGQQQQAAGCSGRRHFSDYLGSLPRRQSSVWTAAAHSDITAWCFLGGESTTQQDLPLGAMRKTTSVPQLPLRAWRVFSEMAWTFLKQGLFFFLHSNPAICAVAGRLGACSLKRKTRADPSVDLSFFLSGRARRGDERSGWDCASVPKSQRRRRRRYTAPR